MTTNSRPPASEGVRRLSVANFLVVLAAMVGE